MENIAKFKKEHKMSAFPISIPFSIVCKILLKTDYLENIRGVFNLQCESKKIHPLRLSEFFFIFFTNG